MNPRQSWNTAATAYARAGAEDPFWRYEAALRRSRQELAGGGSPEYLGTHLPRNGSWWQGFDRVLGGVLDLFGAASAPLRGRQPPLAPGDAQFYGFTGPEVDGPASATAAHAHPSPIGAHATDRNQEWYMGDLSLDYLPDVVEPQPWLRQGMV